MMKQEKMIDGVRHVLNPKTGEYLPDTEILKGWTYVLDEENFRYYPIYLREVPINQISDQERKEFLEMVAESERQSAEEKEILGFTEAEFDIVPEEMRENYYKTALGYWKPIPEELLQEIPHGKYVTMRRNYLLNQDPKEFIWLKNSDQLNKHLTAVNLQAHEMEDMIVEKLKENSPEYKEAENRGDYLKTVQLQNSFLKTAEEEILTELIYK